MRLRNVWCCLSLYTVIQLIGCSGEHHAHDENSQNEIQHGDDRPGWLDIREMQMDEHNRIQMGVPNPDCDDAETDLATDWDPTDKEPYTCDGEPSWDGTRSHSTELKKQLAAKIQNGECEEDHGPNDLNNPNSCFWLQEKIKVNADWDCLRQSEIEMPDHICMDTPIEYDENPPRSGSHRPLWPKYGEYKYCPPQRWTHSLEHGALVMLYDPCVVDDPILAEDLMALNRTVRDCLRRHVITPYKGMAQPFALITYGCRLMMDRVNEDLASLFTSNNALKGPEHLPDDGQYDEGLLHGAEPVFNSGISDDNLCPKWRNPLLQD